MGRRVSEVTRERVKTILRMGWASRNLVKENARVHLYTLRKLLSQWEKEGKVEKIKTVSGLELWRWKDEKNES